MAAEPDFNVPGFSQLKEIGRGGNSRVYAGLRNKDKHNVVLKVRIVNPDVDEDTLYHKINNQIYGLKEYDIGSFFNCDFIAKYLDYNTTRKYIYTVMEHEQGSMTEYKDPGKLPYQEKVSMLKKILIGLHECHENGVLHLDMKFENVLLRYRNRSGVSIDEPLITDFGFSLRVRDVRSGIKMDRRFGTTGYFAPEQFSSYYPRGESRNSMIYHGSADIWAYGIIAYRLLMEHRVYKSTDKEVIYGDMVRYFKDGNVAELLKRRKYPSFINLNDEDQNDVIELLNATLTWDHNQRLTTRQLLSLPIFEKSAKLEIHCELSNPNRRYFISTKSGILPHCLDYFNDVAMTCPNAPLIIYYHMVDLVYRISSIARYSIFNRKYAREIVVACFLIALNYHYYTNYDGIIAYMNEVGLDQAAIVNRVAAFARDLNYIIYRRYLFETVDTLDDINRHLTKIIPNIEAYRTFDEAFVDANPDQPQNYDQPIVAYATIGEILNSLI